MDAIALDPRLRHAGGFLGRTPQMLIDGKMVGAVSGKTFGVYNPATGGMIANVPEVDKADVDLAVAAARRAFDERRWARKSLARWCTQPFGDDDLDAIAQQANDTIYGLAASVWTRNGGTAHKLASRIRSGTVWINCHSVFDASLPFGGYKQSGWGREMGEQVFHNYTEIKAVTAAL